MALLVHGSELGGPRAWLVWIIAVTFVVYYFSFQTGYSIVNPSVQKDIGLSIAQVGPSRRSTPGSSPSANFSAARCSIGWAQGKFFRFDCTGDDRNIHLRQRAELRDASVVASCSSPSAPAPASSAPAMSAASGSAWRSSVSCSGSFSSPLRSSPRSIRTSSVSR